MGLRMIRLRQLEFFVVYISHCLLLHFMFAVYRNCRWKSEDDTRHDLDDHSSIRYPRHLCWRFFSKILLLYYFCRWINSSVSFSLHFM